MSTPALQSLQIHPDAADPALAQQQARFNTLVQDVALARAALAEWKERIGRHHQVVEPVRRELHSAWREWVLALDAASLQPALSRAERSQLVDLLREAAGALLASGDDDAGIAAILARHGDDEAPAKPTPRDAPVNTTGDEEEPGDAAQDWEQKAAVAAARRAQRAVERRAATAAKQRQQAEQAVSQSLRDVYRRLASALHPDREPDAQQRARKTALMQQANEAYAADNLLALLELQLEAEQLDAAHLAAADRRRLAHYVALLEEQLAELQTETRRLETDFRAATGSKPGTGLPARKADRLITSEAQRMREQVLGLRQHLRLLQDIEETRRWLREERKFR